MGDTERHILWDFDGTLAERPGRWSGCMVEVLDAEQPDHCIRRDMLAPYLRRGFPWHTPEVGHPEFVHADT